MSVRERERESEREANHSFLDDQVSCERELQRKRFFLSLNHFTSHLS